ncbi:MAG TPA: DUF3606 domain-containing protein [Rudaea sp.]
MSTLWEMATSIREERSGLARPSSARARPRQAAVVELDEPARVDYWCRLLGTTPWRLCCAIESVGTDPTAIRRYLGRQSAPAMRLGARSA